MSKKKKVMQKFKRHYMTIKTYLIPMTFEKVSEACKPEYEDSIFLELKDDKNLTRCYVSENDTCYIFNIAYSEKNEYITKLKSEYNVTYRCWDYASTQDYIVQPWGSFKINDLFWKGIHDDRPVKPRIEKLIIRGK